MSKKITNDFLIEVIKVLVECELKRFRVRRFRYTYSNDSIDYSKLLTYEKTLKDFLSKLNNINCDAK